jgi:hypothetical protein
MLETIYLFHIAYNFLHTCLCIWIFSAILLEVYFI